MEPNAENPTLTPAKNPMSEECKAQIRASSLSPAAQNDLLTLLEEGGKVTARLVFFLIHAGILPDPSGYIAQVCQQIINLP